MNHDCAADDLCGHRFSEERELGIYENGLYMKYQAIFGIILRKIQIGKSFAFSNWLPFQTGENNVNFH